MTRFTMAFSSGPKARSFTSSSIRAMLLASMAAGSCMNCILDLLNPLRQDVRDPRIDSQRLRQDKLHLGVPLPELSKDRRDIFLNVQAAGEKPGSHDDFRKALLGQPGSYLPQSRAAGSAVHPGGQNRPGPDPLFQ